ELGLEAGSQGRLQGQPGDLVLVLIGHELVQVPGDGLGQRGRARRPVLFRGADPFDYVEVAAGVGGVLVRRQVVGAGPDQAVEGGLGRSGPIEARRGQPGAGGGGILAGAARGPARYWRPRRNAWRFFSTATPFTRIASSMASGGSGSAPVWKPAPTRKTLANWSSPNSPMTIARASSRTEPSRTRSRIGWLVAAWPGKASAGS